MNSELAGYIQFNKLEEIKKYFDKKDDKESKKEIQEALSYAAHDARINVVKLLVSMGADVNVNNNHALRGAALIKSAAFGNLEVIEFLVQNGADINAIKDTTHPIVKEWVECKTANQGEKTTIKKMR